MIEGYYTTNECHSGLPKDHSPEITHYLVKDTQKEETIIIPVQFDTLDETTLIKVTESMLRQISTMATKIYQEYPPQDLRHLRPFLTNLDVSNPPEEFTGSPSLWAKRNSLILLVKRIKSLQICLPTNSPEDLEVVLQANSLLELLQHFAPKKTRPATIIPPNNLPAYKIKINPANTAISMFTKLEGSPKAPPPAESSNKAEAEIKKGGWAVTAISIYPWKAPVAGQRPFEFYFKAYDVDTSSTLPGLKKLEQQLRRAAKKTGVINPLRIWITSFDYMLQGQNIFKAQAAYGDRYLDLRKEIGHLNILKLIKGFEATYKEAASIFYSHHSDVFSYETIVTLLMLNTFVEIFWSEGEDPWEDTGAALAYAPKYKDALSTAYNACLEEGLVLGIRIGEKPDEKVYQVPPAMWEIASMKVPVELQGLGPNAVIIGPFLEAAKYDNGSLWKKYFPDTEMPEDKEGRRALAVNIALDLEASIKAIALVFDVKLRELKNNVFNNPEVKMPDNAYPSFANPGKAREYFTISWLRYIKAFPEVAPNFPDYFPYAHYSWNIDFIGSYFKLIQTIIGLDDSWPGLQMNFIPSSNKPINDYFGDTKDPNNMNTLMLFLSPKEI